MTSGGRARAILRRYGIRPRHPSPGFGKPPLLTLVQARTTLRLRLTGEEVQVSDERSLNETEIWIVRVGWLVIAAGIVLGLIQEYGRNRRN